MKYALITGAAGGLGQVFVNTLCEAGWFVFASDIAKAPDKANCLSLFMDITNPSSVFQAKETIQTYTDHLDLIVNNAGMQCLTSLVEADIAVLSKIVDVNLKGMMLVNRTFFDMLYKAKGRIIILSSEIGYHQAEPFHGLYSITKHAVDIYADSLRRELNCIGLKVVKLQPGGFKTNIVDESLKTYDEFLETTQLYKKSLKRLRPFIVFNLNKAKPASCIAKTFSKAVASKNPKICYRVNNLFVLKLLDLFGQRGTDLIFKLFLGKNN